MTDTIKAAVLAVVSDALALAVSFGAPISTGQQTALLSFVGSATTVLVALIAWHESHKTKAQADVQVAQSYSAAVPAAPALEPAPAPPAAA